MVIVERVDEAKSIDIRGRLGKPNGFGELYFGWSDFGDWFEGAGFYQARRNTKGQIIVKLRHYWPTNNQHVEQQAWRQVFKDGVNSWNELSESEKIEWNKKKYPRKMLGFHRYMRYYLKANYT